MKKREEPGDDRLFAEIELGQDPGLTAMIAATDERINTPLNGHAAAADIAEPTAEQLYDAWSWIHSLPRLGSDLPEFRDWPTRIALMLAKFPDPRPYSKPDVRGLLGMWSRRCSPPWPDEQLDAAFAAAQAFWEEEKRKKDHQFLHQLFGVSNELSVDKAQLDFLVDGLLRTTQLLGIGGPTKSLKTIIGGLELSTSVASGKPFLGKFAVSKPRRVLLLSSETDRVDLELAGERMCRAKGIEGGFRRLLGRWLFLGERLPIISSNSSLKFLGQLIQSVGAELVILDPLKDCLSLKARTAAVGNQALMSGFLNAYKDCCRANGATPGFIHHATKYRPIGTPMELDEFNQAGVGDTAGQWLLLSRRSAYDPNVRWGYHELLLNYGRRGGGESGVLALDVDEGLSEGGSWSICVSPWQPGGTPATKTSDPRPGSKGKGRDYVAEALAVMRGGAVQAAPNGRFAARTVRDALHVSGATWKAILMELEASGDVQVERSIMKRGKKESQATFLSLVGHGTG